MYNFEEEISIALLKSEHCELQRSSVRQVIPINAKVMQMLFR